MVLGRRRGDGQGCMAVAGPWEVLLRVNEGTWFDLNLTTSVLRVCVGHRKRGRKPGYRKPSRSLLKQNDERMGWA